jgi:hypothetical protein
MISIGIDASKGKSTVCYVTLYTKALISQSSILSPSLINSSSIPLNALISSAQHHRKT